MNGPTLPDTVPRTGMITKDLEVKVTAEGETNTPVEVKVSFYLNVNSPI